MNKSQRVISDYSQRYIRVSFLSILLTLITIIWIFSHHDRVTLFVLMAALLIATFTPAALLFQYFRSIHRPLLLRDNTFDLIFGTKENILLLTSADALEEYPIDEVMLESIQVLIRNLLRLDSTEDLIKKQTELSILQSQINPHFLYNTLDSIRGQAIIEDAKEVADAIEALSIFYRYSISVKGDFVTIEDEMINVSNYIKIQQYRFENRFNFSIVCENPNELGQYVIPKLTLQPLVENSIYHAFDENEEPGTIVLNIIVTQDRLILRVSDDGSGMAANTVRQMNRRLRNRPHIPEADILKKSTGGLGLQNVNDRIRLLFGNEYGATVYSVAGMGTDVEIIIPKIGHDNIKSGKWSS